jgi:hypothetical protein
MQHCPACNQSYPDGGPAFCPTDRIPLISDAPADNSQSESQEQVIVAPMQSQREHTALGGSPGGGLLKTLLNLTIIGRLFNSDTMGQKYLITVEGKEYAVSMETYYKLRPGQMVEVHLEPKTGKVLGAYPAKGGAGNGGVQAGSNTN